MRLFAGFITFIFLISFRAEGQINCFEKVKQTFESSTFSGRERIALLQSFVGCKAPPFNVKTIKGETLNLDSLKGKVVVINFWFTTCHPCVTEMPALNKLREEYRTKSVVFIAFGRDDAKTISDFLRSRDFLYNIVSSEYDLEETYCIVGGWPTNMVLDKQGVVRQFFSGGYTDEKAKTEAYNRIQPVIEKCLAE